MRLIGNILWLVLSGFWLAVSYAVAGLILCVTIIGIPFGIQSFKLASYSFWPFGRVVIEDPKSGAGGCIGNVLWVVLAGWWLALGHLFTGFLLCLTIIGIPLGIANFKLVMLSLVPFGKDIVSADRVAERDVWMRGPEPIR
ncbi:MAG: YccF domain-containing protein [Acidimicrobiales bacterium]|nr:YccF domain-containing protein [Acidimicrobiales bacterium]